MKMEDIKAGDKLIADGGFTCIEEGRECEVISLSGRLYVNCCGADINIHAPDFDKSLLRYADLHGLTGQFDADGALVGFKKVPA